MQMAAESTESAKPTTQASGRKAGKKWGECCQFGTIVKIEMLKQSLTSRELAREIGIAESTLCDVLMGRNYSIENRRKIVKALELPDSVMFVHDNQPEKGRERIR